MKLTQLLTHGKKLVGLGEDGIPYEILKLKKWPMPKKLSVTISNAGTTLAERIATLKFSYVNSDITDKNFPDPGQVRGKLELFENKKTMTTKEIEAQMEKDGLLQANLSELLEYAKDGWDGKTWCVALGSSWVPPGSGRLVPCLDRDGGERRLYLVWGDPEDRWYESYRFVAVRK